MKHHSTVLIAVTLLAAGMLEVLLIPVWISPWWPKWIVLVTLYWIVYQPHTVGVFTAWGVGLLSDALHGTVLGQQALSLAVTGYLTYLVYLRLKRFPVLQQCLMIFVLSGIFLLLNRTIQGLTGSVTESLEYYLPALTSALLWPWVCILISWFRKLVVEI